MALVGAATEEVSVVALPAIGICVAVRPEMPLLVRQPVQVMAPLAAIARGAVALKPALPILAIGIPVGSIPVTMEQNDGAAGLVAVQFPNTVSAAAVEREKVSAGVLVAVATLVVNSGESVPALNDVTVADEVLQVGQVRAPVAAIRTGPAPLSPALPTLPIGIPVGTLPTASVPVISNRSFPVVAGLTGVMVRPAVFTVEVMKFSVV
jgi:hypothetical protein